jgi:hypothetical protein
MPVIGLMKKGTGEFLISVGKIRTRQHEPDDIDRLETSKETSI